MMIHGVDSVDELVYHYTSAETARDYILRNKTLKLSMYANTNDPKETKAWQFDLGTNENRDLGPYSLTKISERFSDALKERTKVACFSMDAPPLTGNHMEDILHRGYAKPRMWAQYGENHRGVCLVFRKEPLLATVRRQVTEGLLLEGNVHYRNVALVPNLTPHEFMIDFDLYESLGPIAYAHSHIKTHHRALFFEKLLDWRDESEWRIVLLSEVDKDEYVQYDSALVGVMHGAEIDEEVSREITEMTDDREVEHMGLTWKNSSPWYDYEVSRWTARDRASSWGKQ